MHEHTHTHTYDFDKQRILVRNRKELKSYIFQITVGFHVFSYLELGRTKNRYVLTLIFIQAKNLFKVQAFT